MLETGHENSVCSRGLIRSACVASLRAHLIFYFHKESHWHFNVIFPSPMMLCVLVWCMVSAVWMSIARPTCLYLSMWVTTSVVYRKAVVIWCDFQRYIGKHKMSFYVCLCLTASVWKTREGCSEHPLTVSKETPINSQHNDCDFVMNSQCLLQQHKVSSIMQTSSSVFKVLTKLYSFFVMPLAA